MCLEVSFILNLEFVLMTRLWSNTVWCFTNRSPRIIIHCKNSFGINLNYLSLKRWSPYRIISNCLNHLSVFLSMFFFLSILYLSIHLFVYLSTCLFILLIAFFLSISSFYLRIIYLSVYISCFLSVYQSISFYLSFLYEKIF